MIKIIRNLMVPGVFVLILVLQGCTVESGGSDIIVIDDTEPAAPRGVRSITGDEQVIVEWYPNQEKDLEGYIIYRGLEESGDYAEIGQVGPDADSFADHDVANGITYYYAVSAYDSDDNESDLSPETVEDTPRPAGRNVKLEDYYLEPDLSGFDFSYPERGAQAFDQRGIDVYFGVDIEVNVPYIYSDDGNMGIQDLGYTDHIDDVDVSPTQGFTKLFVEAIIGHTYALVMPDGHYAKIRITDLRIDWANGDIGDAWAIFDWAYQLQPDNPELAPARN